MLSGVVQNLLLFITETVFSVYALVLILRAILMFVRADFYNPLSQFIFRLTEPPLSMLRSFMPASGRIDLSCWLLAYAVKVSELGLLILIRRSSIPFDQLLLIGLVQLVQTVIHIYIFVLIIVAISSWFISPIQRMNNTLLALLHDISEPVIRPVRRALYVTGPVDFSILIVLFGLYLLLVILHSLY